MSPMNESCGHLCHMRSRTLIQRRTDERRQPRHKDGAATRSLPPLSGTANVSAVRDGQRNRVSTRSHEDRAASAQRIRVRGPKLHRSRVASTPTPYPGGLRFLRGTDADVHLPSVS